MSFVRENPMMTVQDILESDNIVAGLHRSNAFADGLHNACAFMSEYDGEGPFWIFAG